MKAHAVDDDDYDDDLVDVDFGERVRDVDCDDVGYDDFVRVSISSCLWSPDRSRSGHSGISTRNNTPCLIFTQREMRE